MGIIAGVKRLYDLVKVRDEALRCAFYYALRDSLVAESLEQASRIAYSGNKRWARVVTLQVSSHFTPDTYKTQALQVWPAHLCAGLQQSGLLRGQSRECCPCNWASSAVHSRVQALQVWPAHLCASPQQKGPDGDEAFAVPAIGLAVRCIQ